MTPTPRRLQHRRTAGARLPDGAVLVTRASRWGNPFPVDLYGRDGAIARYREWITTGTDRLPIGSRGRCLDPVRCRAELPTLRGRDLACSCAPGLPCHADVLLELANGPDGKVTASLEALALAAEVGRGALSAGPTKRLSRGSESYGAPEGIAQWPPPRQPLTCRPGPPSSITG